MNEFTKDQIDMMLALGATPYGKHRRHYQWPTERGRMCVNFHYMMHKKMFRIVLGVAGDDSRMGPWPTFEEMIDEGKKARAHAARVGY